MLRHIPWRYIVSMHAKPHNFPLLFFLLYCSAVLSLMHWAAKYHALCEEAAGSVKIRFGYRLLHGTFYSSICFLIVLAVLMAVVQSIFSCIILYGHYLPTVIFYYWYSITHSLFHSRLNIFLFFKSFPPQPFLFFFQVSLHGFPQTAYCYFWAYPSLLFSFSVLHFSVVVSER